MLDGNVHHSRDKDYITTLNCTGSAACAGNTDASSRYYVNANRAKTYGMELHAEYLGWTISPYVTKNVIRRELGLENLSTFDTGTHTNWALWG
ncbi:MAG: hypothetical protein ACSLEN_07945 [Candidatus Malihini olakiniferum]